MSQPFSLENQPVTVQEVGNLHQSLRLGLVDQDRCIKCRLLKRSRIRLSD